MAKHFQQNTEGGRSLIIMLIRYVKIAYFEASFGTRAASNGVVLGVLGGMHLVEAHHPSRQ